MGREIIVSSGDALQTILLDHGGEVRQVPLEHAGALCVSESQIYCACGDVIWKMDRRHLIPTGIFGGGPDMRSLTLSKDATKLFALSGEADSVLMLSAKNGEPLLLNRAGVNPRGMALDGDCLAIAGGESGMAYIFCAHSLQMLDAIPMPGPVYSVAIQNGTLYALCMTEELSSLLITQKRRETRSVLALMGMPGTLLIRKNDLIAATDGALHIVSLDGKRLLKRIGISAHPVWMEDTGKEVLLLDGCTERLFSVGIHGMRLLAGHAAYAALCMV